LPGLQYMMSRMTSMTPPSEKSDSTQAAIGTALVTGTAMRCGCTFQ
jgi:hypothetical protein